MFHICYIAAMMLLAYTPITDVKDMSQTTTHGVITWAPLQNGIAPSQWQVRYTWVCTETPYNRDDGFTASKPIGFFESKMPRHKKVAFSCACIGLVSLVDTHGRCQKVKFDSWFEDVPVPDQEKFELHRIELCRSDIKETLPQSILDRFKRAIAYGRLTGDWASVEQSLAIAEAANENSPIGVREALTTQKIELKAELPEKLKGDFDKRFEIYQNDYKNFEPLLDRGSYLEFLKAHELPGLTNAAKAEGLYKLVATTISPDEQKDLFDYLQNKYGTSVDYPPALVAFAKWGNKAAQKALLINVLNEDDEKAQAYMDAIVQSEYKVGYNYLLEALTKSPTEGSKISAMRNIMQLASSNDTSLTNHLTLNLVKVLNSKQAPVVRSQAVIALKAFDNDKAKQAVEKAKNDRSVDVSRAAQP